MARPRKNGRKMATIQDIADQLGLSAMTVSRALNNHPDVKAETRERILEIARALNYRPNRWARSLVTAKSQMIGVVIPDISHNFFSEITRGIQDTIEQEGYSLMLCHSRHSAQRELREIDMLVGSRVEGLIVASQQPIDDPVEFQELEREGVPFVLIDRVFPGYDCPRVTTDDVQVGRLATEHLISLGHRRVAHIRGPEVSTGVLRLQGFEETLRRHGLELDAAMIEAGDFTFDSGYQAMKRLLERTPPPTAVFAANDPMAFGAAHACLDAGFRVPGDVSITGAGSIEGFYHPEPFLSTTAWSRQEMGRRAGELLLRLIQGPVPPEQWAVAVQPELLLRRSTSPPKLARVPAGAN